MAETMATGWRALESCIWAGSVRLALMVILRGHTGWGLHTRMIAKGR